MTFDDISTIKAAANPTTDKNVAAKRKQKGNPNPNPKCQY